MQLSMTFYLSTYPVSDEFQAFIKLTLSSISLKQYVSSSSFVLKFARQKIRQK